MCGIFCCIQNIQKNCCQDTLTQNCDLLKNRGPDLQDVVSFKCNQWNVVFAGYVLWLQGPQATKQPLHLNENYLLFNGDLFGGTLISEKVRNNEGDTKPLFNALIESDDVANTLSKVHGPYALLFCKNDQLYFGRDHYGRRSLLIGYDHRQQLIISSIIKRSVQFSVVELPTIGVFRIDLKTDTIKHLHLTPWNIPKQIILDNVKQLETFLKVEIVINFENHQEPKTVYREPANEELEYHFGKLDKNGHFYEQLIEKPYWKNLINELEFRLLESVRVRVLTQPDLYQDSIGILFSGGLDCTILAVLCHKCLPLETEIHLFNVAFEKSNVSDYLTPDRKTAIISWNELKTLFPARKWTLFEINVTRAELVKECRERITHLINPLVNILDESLGCALWFASRGDSIKSSRCRLLVVGMGADELFGGYTRHRNSFRRGGWSELSRQLEIDWYNLPHRNLARDDRVTADHSRQLRTPYLDENVIEFIFSIPVWNKCYLIDQLPGGIGDKLLLRLLAFHLGLKEVTFFRKRALQFGSRIANSKENAKDISHRLQNITL